uniref:RFX-type winged-helix domain-containing protein n=1 Tax=Ornithorhynchus anatinus TaxID=9258 RepID=A0A6I8NR51_ORNAN
MAEDEADPTSPKAAGAAPQGDGDPGSLLQKLRGGITKSIQNKVELILQDVQKFSDNDKLYLYLQLPSSPSAGDKSLDPSVHSTAEHMYAYNWIRDHLEEHVATCLPKQDVYDAYRRYCGSLRCRPLGAANFGKIIREIFPDIKSRRLGGRGQSKYCYSGIRRKTLVSMPLLPSLDLKGPEKEPGPEAAPGPQDKLLEAACALTCDWAETVLQRSFGSIVDVARFLLQQHLISARSARARLFTDTVLPSAASTAQPADGGERPSPGPPPPAKNGLAAPEASNPQATKPARPEGCQEAAGPGEPPSPAPQPSALPPVPRRSPKDPAPESAPPVPPPPGPGGPREPKRSSEAPPRAPAPNSPQVNALVARQPPLRPRVPCPPLPMPLPLRLPVPRPLCLSPPVLAPKLVPGGTLKMTALPLPVGAGGPRAALPIISMILPAVPAPPARAGGQRGTEAGGGAVDPGPRARVPKRPVEVPSDGGHQAAKAVKKEAREVTAGGRAREGRRKRGRPRKETGGRERSPSSEKPGPPTDSARPPGWPGGGAARSPPVGSAARGTAGAEAGEQRGSQDSVGGQGPKEAPP